jgi:hypothetical protein
MLAFVAWLVYASCLAGVGLWFSISCSTTLRATLYTLVAFLLASVGHWAIWLCLVFVSPFSVLQTMVGLPRSLTPPAVLYMLSAGRSEVAYSNDWELHACLSGFGLFLWALAACILWSMARKRFRMLTSRMPYRRPEPLANLAIETDGKG